MSETTPEPTDTGDLAAAPEEDRLQEPDPDDHCEPADLSDVTEDGDVVDLETTDEPEENAAETGSNESTNPETPPENEAGGS